MVLRATPVQRALLAPQVPHLLDQVETKDLKVELALRVPLAILVWLETKVQQALHQPDQAVTKDQEVLKDQSVELQVLAQ